MRLYYSDKLIKQISPGKKNRVNEILLDISNKLVKNENIFSILNKYTNKKMVGTKEIWKFYIDGNFRIIWTFGKYLNGSRIEEENDIFLLAYSNHDKQVRIANNIDKNINRRNFYLFNNKEKMRYDSGDSLFRLTNEQVESIDNKLPLMISGGAGNGKTIVALNKLKKLAVINPSSNIAYFTFTERLKLNAKKEFAKITDSSINTKFYVVNSLFLDYLNLNQMRVVNISIFQKWYDKKYNSHILFDALDIWVEIRGTIKGYAGKSWVRNYPFDIYEISEFAIKYFLKEKFIYYPDVKEKRIVRLYKHKDEEYKKMLLKIKGDDSIIESERDSLYQFVYKIKEIVDIKENTSLIYERDYIELDDDNSKYEISDKKIIYKIACKYQQWLEENHYYDDNDLARSILFNAKTFKKFDYCVIDEIQDLTELQIKAISCLMNNRNKVMISGDIHQIIQPTIFSISRIKKYYNQKITFKYLTVNHRSQGEIVEFTNKLSDLRRKIIGNRKIETENREIAIWSDVAPFWLINHRENIVNAISHLALKADAAIIVADESDKQYIQSLHNEKSIANLYTVSEIKGLEWEYVLCFNLIGKNKKYFKDIFSSNAKHSGKYRYYFNLLYVAATRARSKLCFIEDKDLYRISEINELFKRCIKVNKFNQQKLNIFTDKDENVVWEINAKKLENQMVYDRAALYYTQINLIHDANRCEALYSVQSNMVIEGINQLININEFDLAYQYAKKFNLKELEIVSYILMNKRNISAIEEKYSMNIIFEIYSNMNATNKRKCIIEKHYLLFKFKQINNLIIKSNDVMKGN